MKTHHYRMDVRWTGDRGEGTSGYRNYDRHFEVSIPGKAATIHGSSDPVFRGDATRYNPEELLVAALSSCHLLWYLHLCADAGIIVHEYSDEAQGELLTDADGSGHFTSVTLHPHVAIEGEDGIARATELHERAHALCFVARSVNFPVRCEPTVRAR